MKERFLNSEDPGPERLSFEALGHAGSEHYSGLETFPNPGCLQVAYTSDEVVAYCPITKQPDFYTVSIILMGAEKCIESKSLKLWLRQFNNEENGLFCEALAVYIRDQICGVVDSPEQNVQVTLIQKSRGGIEIKAIA